MTSAKKSILLLLSCTSLLGACADGGSADGVRVTLGVSGKDDSVVGSDVDIFADGYTRLSPEEYVNTSVYVGYRTDDRLGLQGYGVKFDVSNYWETQTGTSCDYDFDCDGYNQGYCSLFADWDGECVALNTPEGRWKLDATSDIADVTMGFMLYDREEFESSGATVTCGTQNVFTSIEFNFDTEEILVDGRDWYWASDCGLDLQRDTAVTQDLSAFGVPVRDYALWDFDGDYPHTFRFTAN